MFREDKLTVKRDIYEKNEGEVIHLDPAIVYENIPCHLSLAANNTVKIQDAPHVYSEGTIFLDYKPNFDIRENDTLYVTTKNNQTYKLIAGEVKIYALSIQVRCRQEKIIES